MEGICTNSAPGPWNSQLQLQPNNFQDLTGKSVLQYRWLVEGSLPFYILALLSALNLARSLAENELTAPYWNSKSRTQWTLIFPACKIPLPHQWNTCFVNETENAATVWHWISRLWITVYFSGWMPVRNPPSLGSPSDFHKNSTFWIIIFFFFPNTGDLSLF